MMLFLTINECCIMDSAFFELFSFSEISNHRKHVGQEFPKELVNGLKLHCKNFLIFLRGGTKYIDRHQECLL